MKVAIIGGGFSGTSLSAHLIFHGSHPLTVYMIEKSNLLGLGTAYSTPFPWHLLNVPTGRMGALDDDPEGFFTWLADNETQWRQADPEFKHLTYKKDNFLPRKLYGIYLSDLLDTIRKAAAQRNIVFETIKSNAIDLERTSDNTLRILLDDREPLEVDSAVLASGVKAIKSLSPSSERYVDNIWECSKQMLSAHIADSNKNSVFFIIGTGLTMVDMATSLYRLGYQGTIAALSRHGKLPESHKTHRASPAGNISAILKSKSLVAKFHSFHKELERLEADGGDWRQLMDALRAWNAAQWQQHSNADQRRFLRHLLSIWNRHRHRMAPESAEMLERLQLENRLWLIKGKILGIKGKEPLEIHYKTGDKEERMTPDYAYNCIGPELNPKNSDDPLIQNLIQKGWIIPDDLNLGFKVDHRLRAAGPLSEKLSIMGLLLFGSRFETIAVPELRHQAKIIASYLRGLRTPSKA